MSSHGSRLPGDSEDTDRYRSEERAEARLSGELAARFTDYVDAHGLAKSGVVCDALGEFLPSSERSQYVLPADPDLADAYLALAGEEARTVSVEVAEDILCREPHLNTPKELIRQEVLDPLAATGLVPVKYGKVGVHQLTPRDEILKETDDE